MALENGSDKKNQVNMCISVWCFVQLVSKTTTDLGLCLNLLLLTCIGFTKPCVYCMCAVSKQINDKERVAAALENPDLLRRVNECITDADYR